VDKVGFLVRPEVFGKCSDSASGQTPGAMVGFVLNHPRDDGLADKNHGYLLQSAFFWAIYHSKAIQRKNSKIETQFQSG
jgi:hypothetical protein